MVRFVRLTLYSVLIVSAMGLGHSFWRTQAPASGAKSVDVYWASTGLESQALEDIFDSQVCYSSEKHFLACANALQSAALFVNLKLQTDGELTSLNNSNQKLTEKELIAPWQKLYQEEIQSGKNAISFLSLWNQLEERIGEKKKSRAIGAGLNGFLSLMRDPHTYLIPIDYYKEVISQSHSKSNTVGMTLGQDQIAKEFFIRKVIENSVADLGGLKKGDRLISVNGHPVKGLSFPAVSELLKGEEGTKILITISRGDKKLLIPLVRKSVVLSSVTAKLLPANSKVGVLTINRFAKKTCDETQAALMDLQRKHQISGLLLDLRDNPGGQMEEAACVTSLFIGSKKKIFELRFLDKTMEPEAYFGGRKQLYRGPLAVLMNSGSASAAEIVAGALRDYGRAYLVGERSFGKGSFQEGEVWEMNKNLALFETKGFYYLPSGKSPQIEGLLPDLEIKSSLPSQQREGDQYWSALTAQPIYSWVPNGIGALPTRCARQGIESAVDSEVIVAQKSIECLTAGLSNDIN